MDITTSSHPGKYPDDVWRTVLFYVTYRRDIKCVALVCTQLARIAQAHIFASIKLRGPKTGETLFTLIGQNPRLRVYIMELRVLSDHESTALLWLQSEMGVALLQQLSTLTRLSLEDTDFCTLEAIEGILTIGLHSKITSLSLLNCIFGPASRSAVMKRVLATFPDLQVLEATASNTRYTPRNYDNQFLCETISDTSQINPSGDKSYAGIRALRIYSAKEGSTHRLILPFADFEAWLHRPGVPQNLQSLNVLLQTYQDISSFLRVYRIAAENLRFLKLHVPNRIYEWDSPPGLTLSEALSFHSLPPLVQADMVHIVAEDTWKHSVAPYWVAEFLLAIFPDPVCFRSSRRRAPTLHLQVDMVVPWVRDDVIWSVLDQVASLAAQMVLSGYIILSNPPDESVTEGSIVSTLLPSCAAKETLIIESKLKGTRVKQIS